jgi:predicted TIM-barrel fold metal-dependent hydrolase
MESVIRKKALAGEIPEGLRVFDAHAHITMGTCTSLALYTLDIEKSVEHAEKIGIKAQAVSHTGAFGCNPVAPNDFTVKLCEEKKGRLYFYLVYDPHYSGECLAQLDTYKNHPACIGVKIHPRDCPADLGGADYEPLFDYTAREDILVLAHTWDTEAMNRPVQFKRHLEKHPGMKVLIGHMGGTYRGCMDSIALAKEYENVYCDLNGSLYSQIWIEELLKLAPAEKYVFSTDEVFNDPRIIVGRVLLSELSDGDKEKILCDNFERITGKKLI